MTGPDAGRGLPERWLTMTMPSRPALVAAAGVIAVLVFGYLAGPTLAQFVIGLILVLVLDPLVTWLSRHGLNRGVASVIALVALGLAALVFATVVVTAVLQQGPEFLASITAFLASIRDGVAASDLPGPIKDAVADFFRELESSTSTVNVGELLGALVQGTFTLLGPIISLGMILPFFMFYVLADLPRLGRGARAVVPARWRADVVTLTGIGVDSIATYIRVEAILMVWLGAITFLGLMALSVVVDPGLADFAAFLALVAAVSELIPTFGPYIALIPALVFAATLSPAAFVAVLLLYVVIMFIEGQVLVPRIEGRRFDLHPALVIVLILAMLAVLGPLGAVLAMPLAAAGRDAFRYVFRRSAGMSPEEAAAPSPPDDADRAPDAGGAAPAQA
jgi:predicted PurR-regulated permease PerM